MMAFAIPSTSIIPHLSSASSLQRCSYCLHRSSTRPCRRPRYSSPVSTAANSAGNGTTINDTIDDSQTLRDRIRAFSDTIYNFVTGKRECGLNLARRGWKEMGGNYVKVPSDADVGRTGKRSDVDASKTTRKKVKAVIHFLGGAFVGAAPQLFYQTFLERLSDYGYVVVATPYDLSFDYMKTVDHILEKWDAIEMDLALEYGPLPIIGIGHSAGALLHTITETLFDRQYAKAGHVLVSFNNKPVKGAVPFFKELISPTVKSYLTTVPEEVRKTAVVDLLDSLDDFVTKNPFTPTAILEDLLPVARSSRAVIDQIGPLLEEVGFENVTEFRPTPENVAASIEKRYEVPETLVVRFRSDTIDESEKLFQLLNKRTPVVGTQASLLDLAGTHVTPLTPDLPPAENDAVGLFIRDPLSNLLLRELRALETVVDEWIDSGIKSGRL